MSAAPSLSPLNSFDSSIQIDYPGVREEFSGEIMTGEAQITLHFRGTNSPELERFIFAHPLHGGQPRDLVRSKSNLPNSNGTFQWTSGVRGVCLVVLNAVIAHREVIPHRGIVGERGSIASSLDYALSKRPTWLVEMFGFDAQGEPIASRAFRRSNPNLKRPGPTEIYLNTSFIRPDQIEFRVNDIVVMNLEGLKALGTYLAQDLRQHSTPLKAKLPSAKVDPSSTTIDLRFVREIFDEEIQRALSHRDIFSSTGLRQAVESLRQSTPFSRLAGRDVAIVESGELKLSPGERLGLPTISSDLGKVAEALGSLRFLATPGVVGALAILESLKSLPSSSITYSFQAAHCSEIFTQFAHKRLSDHAEGFVVAAPTAARIFASGIKDFGPLMLFPSMSHKIAATIKTPVRDPHQIRGDFLFTSDVPGTSRFCFESILERAPLLANQVKVLHGFPFEISSSFAKQNNAAFALLGFPNYQFNHRLNRCQLMSFEGYGDTLQETILFLRKDILRSPDLVRGLRTLIRNAWLTLMNLQAVRELVIDSLLSNPLFLSTTARCCGLSESIFEPYQPIATQSHHLKLAL